MGADAGGDPGQAVSFAISRGKSRNRDSRDEIRNQGTRPGTDVRGLPLDFTNFASPFSLSVRALKEETAVVGDLAL